MNTRAPETQPDEGDWRRGIGETLGSLPETEVLLNKLKGVLLKKQAVLQELGVHADLEINPQSLEILICFHTQTDEYWDIIEFWVKENDDLEGWASWVSEEIDAIIENRKAELAE